MMLVPVPINTSARQATLPLPGGAEGAIAVSPARFIRGLASDPRTDQLRITREGAVAVFEAAKSPTVTGMSRPVLRATDCRSHDARPIMQYWAPKGKKPKRGSRNRRCLRARGKKTRKPRDTL